MALTAPLLGPEAHNGALLESRKTKFPSARCSFRCAPGWPDVPDDQIAFRFLLSLKSLYKTKLPSDFCIERTAFPLAEVKESPAFNGVSSCKVSCEGVGDGGLGDGGVGAGGVGDGGVGDGGVGDGGLGDGGVGDLRE